MAGQEDLLKRLAAQLSTLDDEAWCALASRGLLRRARKDLGGGLVPELLEGDGERVRIQVAERVVELGASGISGGTCDCPAAGTCQHLLVACLALPGMLGEGAADDEDEEKEEGDDEQDGSEWLSLDEGVLRKWCGATEYRKALELAMRQVSDVRGSRVVFRNGIDCHLVGGAGLEGVITSAQPRHARMYVVAGVLAYRDAHGLQVVGSEESAMTGFEADLPVRVAVWLEDCVEMGLQYLTTHTVAVARTLAMSCRTGGLHRAGLELDRIAQLIQWQLDRHAKADSGKLFGAMARLRALMVALREFGSRAPDELRGQARTKYGELRRLELIGMGAYPWQSESGFQGLTLLFWAPGEKRFLSLGDSRPRGVAFDPVGRFGTGGPWQGGGSLRDLAGSRFHLAQPKLNEAGRLSAGEGTRVEGLEPCLWPEEGPPVIRIWRELWAGVEQLPGLRRPGPMENVVVIEPRSWGKPAYDEIAQELRVLVEDEEGESLSVVLAYSELSGGAIRLLEQFNFARDRPRLLAFREARGGRRLFPIALFTKERRLDLFLEAGPKKSSSRFSFGKLKAKARVWFGPGEEDAPEVSGWRGYLAPLEKELRERSESGLHRRDNEEELNRWSEDLDRAGLGDFGRSVGEAGTPGGLLRAKYLLLLLGELEGD